LTWERTLRARVRDDGTGCDLAAFAVAAACRLVSFDAAFRQLAPAGLDLELLAPAG